MRAILTPSGWKPILTEETDKYGHNIRLIPMTRGNDGSKANWTEPKREPTDRQLKRNYYANVKTKYKLYHIEHKGRRIGRVEISDDQLLGKSMNIHWHNPDTGYKLTHQRVNGSYGEHPAKSIHRHLHGNSERAARLRRKLGIA